MDSSARRFVLTVLVAASSVGLFGKQPTPQTQEPSASPRVSADTFPLLLVTPGSGGVPTQIVNGTTLSTVGAGFPFGAAFGPGVRAAVGELTGDFTSDFVIAMGPGGGLVRLFNGATTGEIASGYPFGPGFAGGVSVATGDVTGDGRVDIIVGQATGGGSVIVFDGRDISVVLSQSPFGAGYAGGVNVAAGDVDGDGRADILVGQASGGLVTVISGASGAPLLTAAAYAPSTGTFVAAGDVNGDGRAEIIAAPGAGGGPVFVYDLANARLLSALTPYASAPGGVRVAAADVDADGRADIITAPGPGAAAELRIYSGATFALRASQLVFPATYTGGAFVAAAPPGSLRFTSAAQATFVEGSPGTFTARASGTVAVTSITLTGALPSGITFSDGGTGSATLSGTAAPGTGGTYAVTLRATTLLGVSVSQAFVLTVSAPPAVTSAPATTFTVGVSGSFALTSTGLPIPTLTVGGVIPAGLSFTAGAGGTGTISGTPAVGTGGVYSLGVNASNGVGPPAAQSLTVTVHQASAITSTAAATFSSGTFQSKTITTSGYPRPTVTLTGALPTGVTFANNGDGTATLAGTASPGSVGTYPLALSASNGIGSAAAQALVLTVTSPANAANDTYGNGVGNTQFSVGAGAPATPAIVVSGSVLNNDVGIAPLTAGPSSIATTHGGHVAMASNGAFLYTPATGFAGPSDSFVYSMTDSLGHVEAATVTINLGGVVWYVRAGAVGGDGRSQTPLATMGAASSVGASGHVIYVHDGSVAGTTTLKTGQTLWGSGATFTLNGLTIPATTTPTLLGGLTLADGVQVRAVTVDAGAGAAITGTGLTGIETLTDVSVAGGTSGVSLTNVGGTFTMNGGTIAGVTAGESFAVSGGSGTITVGAAISGTVGRSVQVQGRSGGTVTFSGPIADTGNGVWLDGNTGATIAFTGGLNVVTSATTAFTAINGGTVTATQNNSTVVNTLTSNSGDALQVIATSIGSAGLTFRRISSGNSSYGSGVGITLDTTGLGPTHGSLTVVGNGTSGSGGVIRRKSGADGSLTSGLAMYLHETKAPSFRWMELADFENGAIIGRSVAGFALEDSVIDGAVGTAVTEGALMFGRPDPAGENGLVGAGLLRNTRISGSSGHNGAFYNQSGVMTLQIDGTTRPMCALSNNAATGGDGLVVRAQGSANATVTITRCQFRGNRDAGLRVLSEDTSSVVFSLAEADVHHVSGQGDTGVVLRNAGSGQLSATVTASSFYALPGANLWIGQAPFDATSASLLQVTVTNNDAFEQVTGATSPPWVIALSSTIGEISRTRVRIENGPTGLVQAIQTEGLRITTPDAGTTPAADISLLSNHTDTEDSSTPYTAVISATQAGANLCTNIRGNTFHWNPPPAGGPLLLTQANGATLRLERGVAPLASTPSAVLTANNDVQTLNQVVGTIAVVENGTCQLPTP